MTYEDVMKRYHEYLDRDEEHGCSEASGEDFVICEVCQSSRQARDWLSHNAVHLVELLEKEHYAKERLMERVIQDVEISQRSDGLQQALLYALGRRM